MMVALSIPTILSSYYARSPWFIIIWSIGQTRSTIQSNIIIPLLSTSPRCKIFHNIHIHLDEPTCIDLNSAEFPQIYSTSIQRTKIGTRKKKTTFKSPGVGNGFFFHQKGSKKQPTQPPPLIHRCTILVLDGPKGMSYALATAPDPFTGGYLKIQDTSGWFQVTSFHKQEMSISPASK